jgi:hypothetical protein
MGPPDAGLAAKATAEELAGLPASTRRTITDDNGGEFARHDDVTAKIGFRAYFCDPHSPWQRGGIENANGRLAAAVPVDGRACDAPEGSPRRRRSGGRWTAKRPTHRFGLLQG